MKEMCWLKPPNQTQRVRKEAKPPLPQNFIGMYWTEGLENYVFFICYAASVIYQQWYMYIVS